MNVHPNLTLSHRSRLLPLLRIKPFLRLPRVHVQYLSLAAAAFFILFYNFSFWETFFVATGGARLANVPLYIAAFALLTLTFNAFLTLFSFRYVIKPVLTVLFFVTAFSSYFMNRYGIVIDASMMQNVIETDVREAAELLNWNLALTVTLLGVLPSMLVWRLKLEFPTWRRALLLNPAVMIVSLLVAGMLVMVFFKTLAPAVREYRQMRFLLTPTNVIQAGNSYLKHKLARAAVIAPLGSDAMKGTLWAQEKRRTVTIMVVGETARAMNFSLNGYQRDTNPLLSRQAGLLNFSAVQSCGTATAISVPCLFSGMARPTIRGQGEVAGRLA